MRLSRFFSAHPEGNPEGSRDRVSSPDAARRHAAAGAAGIYAWLPLGLRVLKKIEQIVREEQNRAGAIELLMPRCSWPTSGARAAATMLTVREMLRIADRHKRELLYGPTNEEMITEIFRAYVKSYKSLPLISTISNGNSAMSSARGSASCAAASF